MQYYSLLSVVFMMGFVLVFDRVHQERRDSRFCTLNLLGSQEVSRIIEILAACEDC